MEELNISNSQKTIQDLTVPSKIFLHLFKPDFLPVESTYVQINDLINYENNLFETIIINDLLDYLPYNETTNILNTIIDKLKIGGKLIIQSPDLYKLCCSCVFGDVDMETIKAVLYSNKKSINTIYDLQAEIKNRNMIIQEQRYVNIFEFYIEAEKA
jgi:predicted SAM-dependent methyltransferase